MSSSTLIELFGHIVFSFTRGVKEHYNSEEPEFTAESFGYNPLDSTGREWYYQPIEEFIRHQEYGREATALDYSASSGVKVMVIDACSPEDNDETQENEQDEDRKRLRPSALRTVCKSMYIGALISLLAAFFVGTLCILVSYICYKTMYDCQFYRQKSIPIKVQLARTISEIISFVYLVVHLVLRNHAISFPTFSAGGSEKTYDPSEFPYIRFGCGISSCSTSIGHISFRDFQFTEDSAQRYLSF